MDIEKIQAIRDGSHVNTSCHCIQGQTINLMNRSLLQDGTYRSILLVFNALLSNIYIYEIKRPCNSDFKQSDGCEYFFIQ